MMPNILVIAISLLFLTSESKGVSAANCSVGEIYTLAGCAECPIGKYSLKPDGACTLCPEHSNVCFGSSIISTDGYWRAVNTSATLQRCLLQAGCPSTNLTGDDACAHGYTGFGCSSCNEGLALDIGSSSCNICEAQDMAYAVIIVTIGLVAVVFLCTQHSAVRSSFQTKDILPQVEQERHDISYLPESELSKLPDSR